MSLIDRNKMLFPYPNKREWETPAVSFNDKVRAVAEGVDYCIYAAGSHDVPTGDFEIALELIKRITTLFDVIAHGETGHREWLKEAIEAHFQNLPMPDYKAK